jgi:hypothetical protein
MKTAGITSLVVHSCARKKEKEKEKEKERVEFRTNTTATIRQGEFRLLCFIPQSSSECFACCLPL